MTSDAIGQEIEQDDLAEYNANEAADYKDEDKPTEDEDLSELLEDESDEDDDEDESDEDDERGI